MMNKIFILLKKLTLIVLPLFLLHVLVFQQELLSSYQEKFRIQVWQLYLVSLFFSVLSIVLMQKTSEKNFESTGFVFIVVLTLKMVVYYFLFDLIRLGSLESSVEKINFGLIVISFLIIDIFLASKILNKK
ncbi:hypothetical protein [Flavobacterium sp. N2270]|uniref:hypothetical protein n=1 Tax=Flavobacterium sp. N2270 TaxID=2986831 RepID=UPI002224E2F9|nr:hypothetical protein [Flavobacterium sp. N2270]